MQIQSSKIYSEENFKNLKNSASTFNQIEFDDCNFIDCNFSESTFSNCRFSDCKFEGCDLSLLKLNESKFSGTTFKKCKLTGVDFSDIVGIVKELDFFECVMHYTIWSKLELNKRKFIECDLKESSFMECELESADFSNSNLKDVQFQDCNLHKANFVKASNYFINSKDNFIVGAKFSLPEAEVLLRNLDIEIVEEED